MNKVCRLKFIAQCSCMDTLAKTYDKTRNCDDVQSGDEVD